MSIEKKKEKRHNVKLFDSCKIKFELRKKI